jgi:membrane-bound serine protease (ClpP class)
VSKIDVHVGEQAIVVTTLRPAGRIALHGSQYDALSSGNFIEVGKPVTIIAIEGEKIIVEESIS